MPSPLVVPVACISAIRPHSNADSLEIAQVLGWQCVVKRGQYKVNDRVVYFAPDTVIPLPLSDAWGITNYLDRQRIKATRLRGEPSFGLVMPCENTLWEVGDNVASHYGVTKYEAPQRGQGKHIDNPDAQPRDPLFPEYTHIANLRHFPDIFGADELVVVTEKLHGTNSRIGIVNGQWMAGSHRIRRGEGDALYWSPKKTVERMVEALAKHHKQVIAFGEILGSSVQSLDYGYEGYGGYRAFDVLIDGRYLDFHSFNMLCFRYKVPTVPMLGYGFAYSFEYTRALAFGPTEILPVSSSTALPIEASASYGEIQASKRTADHLREGVVVRPLIERTDPRFGRCVLKYVSDDFLLAKKSDFAEV